MGNEIKKAPPILTTINRKADWMYLLTDIRAERESTKKIIAAWREELASIVKTYSARGLPIYEDVFDVLGEMDGVLLELDARKDGKEAKK